MNTDNAKADGFEHWRFIDGASAVSDKPNNPLGVVADLSLVLLEADVLDAFPRFRCSSISRAMCGRVAWGMCICTFQTHTLRGALLHAHNPAVPSASPRDPPK